MGVKVCQAGGGMGKSITGDKFFHPAFLLTEQGHLAHTALWLSEALVFGGCRKSSQKWLKVISRSMLTFGVLY